MAANAIPDDLLEELSQEVCLRLAQQLTDPIIIVVEVDADLRARAAQAGVRVAHGVRVVATGDAQEALSAVRDQPTAALWLCEGGGIDGQRTIEAARRRCPLARIAVRAAPLPVGPAELWSLVLEPEPACVLPAGELLAYFPQLVRATFSGWDRSRQDLVRAEIARRLLERFPRQAVRSRGFAVRRIPEPPTFEQAKTAAARLAMQSCDFNKAAAARTLEISRTTLDGYCDRLGLNGAGPDQTPAGARGRRRHRSRRSTT